MARSERSHPKAIKLTGRFQLEVIAFVVLLVLFSLGGLAGIIYITADQELSKSFFSAHRDLRRIWEGLLPAVVLIASGVGILASGVAVLGLAGFKRSVEGAGLELLETIESLGKGKLAGEAVPSTERHLTAVTEATGRALASVQQHVLEVKGISAELQRAVMRLNYLTREEEQVTIAELEKLSSNLNTLSRELNNSLKWFET